jgi:uncharacterized protein (DUF1501 family)
MQRRHLLAHAAALAAPLAARPGWAAPGPVDAPRFLLVFLRGGYDCANLLVPHASPFYYEARPNLAIARPGSGPQSAMALDAQWGLAPAVADALEPMWRAGGLAFVPFAGTENVSRSHFETQDHIELGQAEGARVDFSSGFLNRLAAAIGSVPAIGFTSQLPLALRGRLTVPNLALNEVGQAKVDARQAGIIRAMYRDTPLAASVSGGFETREEVSRELGLGGEMEAASRNAITAKGFEGEARRVARVMRERYRLGFIDVGGWDTHVAEGGATGTLATKLGELSRGLRAYAEDMGPAWRQTTVVVVSEFGRTFRENGNRGTDHGHGSVYWVLGGAVRGGRVVGEQVGVAPNTLFQDRDYPVLNDYRAVLGGLFARLYGLDAARLAEVFPQSPPRDLGLL